MSDIFISYAREDRPRAAAIAKALEAQGWSVWWDWIIPAGKKFAEVIEEEIGKARCVVVLWSARSVARDWVVEEASEGKARGILVPVLIGSVKPPMGFRSIQAADLTGWQGDATGPPFEKLWGDIAAMLGVATAASVRAAGQRGEWNSVPYVWIPPGEFWMGAAPGDDEAQSYEKPRRRVSIARGFWLGETPVTVAAYKRFAQETGRALPPPPEFNPDWSNRDHPIVNVAWDEAEAYCKWAGGRLPADAEWEYAARGGQDGLRYPRGNEITAADANYAGSKWKGTSPVRSYPPNAWSLYDMAGNVWEWTADWYDEDYYASLPSDRPAEDPRSPQSGTLRVLRGGSFDNQAVFLRASLRSALEPVLTYNSVGFRCVRPEDISITRAESGADPQPPRSFSWTHGHDSAPAGISKVSARPRT